MTAITLSASSISTLSVISKHRFDGRTPVRAMICGHLFRHARLHELPSRQVHGYDELAIVLDLEARRHQCRFLQHPRAELDDEAALLGEGNELGRREEAPLRVLPAHERFDTGAARVGERDDRLEEQSQLVALQRTVERVLGRVASESACAHRVVEHRDATATGFLRVIHRRVRVAQELLGTFVTRAAERDTAARAHEGFRAAHDERLRHRPREPLGNLNRTFARERCRQVFAQDGELVATEAGHGVTRAGVSLPGGGRPR